ncbi:hypothetical protein CKO28_18125 [Rhodovibrio sodomensis]|uniref:Helix-turn-helix domain-containing protein n=1 Tax=Rhodovibrio sodomensis TaxID=1088 RepID=A0ABS1DHK2_9PROT|nr:helix-turn-helix domain-containing protein [Rhodovibrio sodomensis]MBK1669955.1 hypothetical protein [Rhodovibrio sodomensis]
MSQDLQTRSAQKLALSIPEAAKAASSSRSTIFNEIGSGRLRARKLGRRTVILVDDLERWLEGLPPKTPSDAA